jgi:nitroreductase
MENTTTPQTIENALKWRYATKRFDPARQIPDAEWQLLQQSLRLAPSSFGLQPWQFIVVSNPELRAKLQEHSWNQPQIVEASKLVVITSAKAIADEEIDSFINFTATTRGMAASDLAGYRQMIAQFVKNKRETNTLEAWTTKQAYIALGFLMSSAAMMGIDTCPIEGISPPNYDEILGLNSTQFSTRVVCALGYRSSGDNYAMAAKVRYPLNQVIREIK